MVSITNVMIGILNYLLVPLTLVNTVTDVTTGLLCSNRRYNLCYRLEPTLRSGFSICGPVTDITIGVLILWPPFYLLMLIFCSKSRMLIVSS